ncbi:hypothetical protein BZG35_16385 [Brevundimonas sp. LM2]|nr:hypothetical protein BZG35_16385 [Brevundimonas sp. LM2]
MSSPCSARIQPSSRSAGHALATACAVLALAAGQGAAAQASPSVKGADEARTGGPITATGWWIGRIDPVAQMLIERTLISNPSLEQAAARIDEAAAALGAARADGRPTADGSFSATQENSDDGSEARVLDGGLDLNWTVDLFGRVAAGSAAARARLSARTADAALMRLALTTQIADAALQLQACRVSEANLAVEIESRRATLDLTRLRREAGLTAPIDEARAATGLAAARTSLVLRRQDCDRLGNVLANLAGMGRLEVDRLIGAPSRLPTPWIASTRLPADLLVDHLAVSAARQDAEAAIADVKAARAERMPRLDLAAVLSGRWFDASGSALDVIASAFGPALSIPFLDGGRGTADVQGAEARYRGMSAGVELAIRRAAQDIDDAIAAADSARARELTSADALDASAFVLRAVEAQWRSGAVSQFELEDARRQYNAAQESAVAARRDRGQASIALVLALGGATPATEESDT